MGRELAYIEKYVNNKTDEGRFAANQSPPVYIHCLEDELRLFYGPSLLKSPR
jgi:hypothetical protein